MGHNTREECLVKLSEIDRSFKVNVLSDAFFASMGTLQHSGSEMLSFCAEKKYIKSLQENGSVSAVLTLPGLASSIPDTLGVAVTENPKLEFYRIHNYLAKETNFYGINEKSKIDVSAKVSDAAFVSKYNVTIGKRSIIGPKACIMPGTVIGDDVIIGPGSVIGGEGFEFKRCDDILLPVVHAGGVKICNKVEIQSNSTVDKSVFGEFTLIGEATKIDNLVHVAHNVLIGKRVLIAANAMIAGSVVIGDDVWVGPSVSISSGVSIGDGAFLTLGSVVVRAVADMAKVTGNFAIDHKKFIRNLKAKS